MKISSLILLVLWSAHLTACQLGRFSDEEKSQKKSRQDISSQSQFTFNSNELTPEIALSDLHKWVTHLSQPYFQGRKTGSKGERDAQEVIKEFYKQWELKAFNNKSFFHEFSYYDQVSLGADNSFTIKNKTRVLLEGSLSKDYEPYLFSKRGVFKEGNIIFSGYGISAPAFNQVARYNSYENIDVKDKWVLILDGVPKKASVKLREQLEPYARIEHKAWVAAQKNARGLILISESDQVHFLKTHSNFLGAELPLPVLILSKKKAKELFKNEGLDFLKTLKDFDSGEVSSGFDFSELKAQAAINLKFHSAKSQNLIGKIEVPQAKKSLVIGAHIDGLGSEKGFVYSGADDNASGVALVLELAHKLSSLQKQRPELFKQNIYFVLWSGEELGNLGSAAFMKDFELPVSAYLNFDMIGRYSEALYVQGVGSAKNWKTLLKLPQLRSDLNLQLSDEPVTPTDAFSFYVRGIPVLNLYTGSHEDYHSYGDTSDKMNYQALTQISDWALKLSLELSAHADGYLKYQDYNLKFKNENF